MVPSIDSPSLEYKGRSMIELSFPIPFHLLELHPFHSRNNDEASLFPAIYINIVVRFFYSIYNMKMSIPPTDKHAVFLRYLQDNLAVPRTSYATEIKDYSSSISISPFYPLSSLTSQVGLSLFFESFSEKESNGGSPSFSLFASNLFLILFGIISPTLLFL